MIIYIYFQLFVFISQTAPAQQNTPYFHFTQKQTYIIRRYRITTKQNHVQKVSRPSGRYLWKYELFDFAYDVNR